MDDKILIPWGYIPYEGPKNRREYFPPTVSDEQILDAYNQGATTSRVLASALDISRQTASDRMRRLRKRGQLPQLPSNRPRGNKRDRIKALMDKGITNPTVIGIRLECSADSVRKMIRCMKRDGEL